MASVDELNEILQNTRVSVVQKHDNLFTVSFQQIEFYIDESEVDEYLALRSQITIDPETAIFYPGHYEHLIQFQGPSFVFRRTIMNDDEAVRLSNQDGSLSLEISKVSIMYLLKMLQAVEYRIIRRRLVLPIGVRDRSQAELFPRHLSEVFQRLLTIKINAVRESSYFTRRNKLRQIAEASLFHFTFGTGVSLNLSRTWERGFQRLNRRRGETVQFPRRSYNSDLVSYYQLGLSSDSLILEYLAFYKILEYFYSSASEKVLHTRLISKLITPEFSHTKVSQLRQLTSVIRKHDQKMDEQRMLATVIEQYFTPDEISTWVNEYELASARYFTVPQTIFGQSYTLDLNPDKIAYSLAERIYRIRNALVHNKEGELPRFIPFSGQETMLLNEVPIVLFLAEQLILKTGEDI